jgi:hypothetical protein
MANAEGTNETSQKASSKRRHDSISSSTPSYSDFLFESAQPQATQPSISRGIPSLVSPPPNPAIASALIFGIDIHGRVNEWNDKTAEITEFSKTEAWNKPLVGTFIVPSFKE